MSTQRTRQEWLALIKDQQTSGLTIADYAKRHGPSVFRHPYYHSVIFYHCLALFKEGWV